MNCELSKELLDQYIRRVAYGNSIKNFDSKGLHAGNSFYVYCIHCGIPTEAFPEKPLIEANCICSQCNFLLKQSLLEIAKNAANKVFGNESKNTTR
jgi:hypothetical protein